MAELRDIVLSDDFISSFRKYVTDKINTPRACQDLSKKLFNLISTGGYDAKYSYEVRDKSILTKRVQEAMQLLNARIVFFNTPSIQDNVLKPSRYQKGFFSLIDAFTDDDAASFKSQGECGGVDAELFYPERGASTREAKDVCRTCIVREECLEYALNNGEKFGIWGGLSERERRRIRRARALARLAAGQEVAKEEIEEEDEEDEESEIIAVERVV